MFQSLQQKDPNHLLLTGEEYTDERRYLEEKLLRATELKQNAETSLEFLMDKFKYCFEHKKHFIKEIEINDLEIKRLNKILQ